MQPSPVSPMREPHGDTTTPHREGTPAIGVPCDVVIETMLDGFTVVDLSGRFIDVNGAYAEMLGYTRAELRTMGVPDVEGEEAPEVVAGHIAHICAAGRDRFETRQRHRAGHLVHVEVSAHYFGVEGGRIVAIMRDISARKAAEREIALYAGAFRHSGEGVLVTDHDNRIVAVNEAFVTMTGYALEEVRGQNPRMLASGRTPRETFNQMWSALAREGRWQGEIWDRRKDGTTFPKWISIATLRDALGAVDHYVATFVDISERKATEERLWQLAYRDSLTGLHNRRALNELLEVTLERARAEHTGAAVVLIDLDRFKLVNDVHGHQVGDGLLVSAARRLESVLRGDDVLARVGGDEFAIVLRGRTTAGAAAAVAARALAALRQPCVVSGHDLHGGASAGFAVFPDDSSDAAGLLQQADTALFEAKAAGRNAVKRFVSAMNRTVRRRQAVEAELRRAVAEGALSLHFQPQFEGRTLALCGVEALARWTHPVLGPIGPDEFIPIAEECGLIGDLGAWVLDEACREVASWRARGAASLRVAVNLSVHQLSGPLIVALVREALRRHGLPGAALELEVTESAAMKDPEVAIGALAGLRSLGVRLAIDDFGTGYSSLAYLRRLPIDALKLDRSFVCDIETSADAAAICAATIALAHTLGLEVVAEGVESEAQRGFLADLHGCDLLQGYLLGRPQAPDALAAIILPQA